MSSDNGKINLLRIIHFINMSLHRSITQRNFSDNVGRWLMDHDGYYTSLIVFGFTILSNKQRNYTKLEVGLVCLL